MESLQSYIDVMVRQIRDSHEKKEEALENRLRELKVTIRDMVQKHEAFQVLNHHGGLST